jgi:hypothetical protein
MFYESLYFLEINWSKEHLRTKLFIQWAEKRRITK